MEKIYDKLLEVCFCVKNIVVNCCYYCLCAETSDYVYFMSNIIVGLCHCCWALPIVPLDLLEFIGQMQATIFSQLFLHYS